MANGDNGLGVKIFWGIVAVLLVVASAIIIARQLFPFFLTFSIISLVVLIISGLIELFFRDHQFLEITDYVSLYIAIAFVLFVLGMFITYEVGYGLGGTPFGQLALSVYGIKQEVTNSVETAINQAIDASCQTMTTEQCSLLRTSAKTVQTVQEVSDLADKIKTANNIATKLANEK